MLGLKSMGSPFSVLRSEFWVTERGYWHFVPLKAHGSKLKAVSDCKLLISDIRLLGFRLLNRRGGFRILHKGNEDNEVFYILCFLAYLCVGIFVT